MSEPYNPAKIRAHTGEVIATLRRPAAIWPGSGALRARDDDLIGYGLPPRGILPRHFARWQRALSVPMRSVAPEFSITGAVHVLVPRLIEDNATGATWSGAVVRAPLAEEMRAGLIVAARAYARLMIFRCGPA